MSMARLAAKAAIITGGEGSIGMATARAFVAEGANVFLAGVSEPDLKAGAAELGAERAGWKVTDVTRPRSRRRWTPTLAVDGGMSS